MLLYLENWKKTCVLFFRKNFRFLWYMTFQSVLIRPITLFLMGIFDADGSVPIPGVSIELLYI